MARLSLVGVGKRFGPVEAVRSVNLDVRDGEFVVLVGPSGCGKSTLLRVIAGLEDITSGEILLDGRRLNDVAPRDRDMAMVFQDYALYPQMTVAENLGFALKMRGMPSAEIAARVRKVAAMMEMDGLLDRRPKALSGGQRQRVALGRALIRDPSVFLFDEPLSNLDAKLRVGMRMEIRKLQISLGTTSIYVTHDQIEAMTMADRIVVMRGGAVQQIGSPMELYLRPANSFVATFIGSPPTSLVEAPVQWSGEMASLSFAGHGPLPLPPEQSRALAAAGVDRVVAGLRAEHVLVDPDGPFVSDVVLVEDHGAESVAVLSLGGREVMARVRPGTVRVGDRGLRFGLDTAGMRLFHPVDDHALV